MAKLLNISNELANTLNKARHEFKNPHTNKPVSYTVAIEHLIGKETLDSWKKYSVGNRKFQPLEGVDVASTKRERRGLKTTKYKKGTGNKGRSKPVRRETVRKEINKAEIRKVISDVAKTDDIRYQKPKYKKVI